MSKYGVILFHTTSSALHAEKMVRKASYSCKLIPVPREYSSDCGIALRFQWDKYNLIRELLLNSGVQISDMLELSDQSRK